MASRSTLYTPRILRLAASLPEPQALEQVHGSASQRSPTCGSTVSVEVQLDSGGRIAAVSQQVQACAFGQAAAAVVASGAVRRDRDEVAAALGELEAWLAGESPDPPGWPGFAALAPALTRRGRHGAILLPLRALLSALGEARR
jgi:NifU-like protein involved in Fe-S cluster formation